ncbi:MAG TPA: CPBP family intramembrane glutamic endopeptidase [Bacteroidales bacterium]|nr:CPBP family intramembrane glutamic endopeptidase [Bacteroidales bacterium]
MNHLERALDNQNQGWKYLVTVASAFLASNIIGAIPLFVVLLVVTLKNGGLVAPPANITDLSAYGISSNLGLFLMMIPFVVGLITIILLMKPLHKRSYKEVINGTSTIRWNRFLFAAFVWIVIMAVYFLISYQASPKNFQFSLNINSFIVLVILSLILIPFQTAFEEVLFRGYLSQGIAAWTRNRLLVLIIPSFVFGLMHSFNPEVNEYGFWAIMPQYWLFGLLFGLTTLLDDGIEVAMGAHAANNIFSSIVVTTKSSVLQTSALFIQDDVNILKETLAFIAAGVLFLLILGKKYNWNYSILRKRVGAPEIGN